ncbi:MAG: hypothetical protein WCK00_10545 [Deltaproteobacteria bacterium]|jgi:hypothetical protein
MSYINGALRKAPRERDGRYARFGGIITSGPKRPGRPRKRRFAVRVVVMLKVERTVVPEEGAPTTV